MALNLITAPSVKPVSVADVEAQVRASLTAETTLIDLYIAAVTAKAENHIKRALITQTWELSLDCFPFFSTSAVNGRFGSIKLPMAPVQSITSVKYIDSSGVQQTISASDYKLSSDDPAEILPVYGANWPVCRIQHGAVIIRYVAGYGAAAASVPEPIRAWILMNVANLYENRETVVVGNIVNELSTMADSLLDSYRLVMF